MLSKTSVDTPIKLYKCLMKSCEMLPRAACNHYKNMVRQEFKSHRDETDKERVKQIIQRSIEDADWIVKKYKK